MMGWANKAIPRELTVWIDSADPPQGSERLKGYIDACERLKKGIQQLPLPHGFREAILGLRAMVRIRCAEKMGIEEQLRLMHWLAAAQSFCIPFASRLHEPGFNVFEAAPKHKIKLMKFDWNHIGCNSLDSLSKTDKKLMLQTWGTPKNHTTAHALYNDLWNDIEKRLIQERAATAGLTPTSYVERQKEVFAEIAKENEQRTNEIEEERTLSDRAGKHAASLVDNAVFLDLETTGLSRFEDKILEIGIVDEHGNVLFESYIKPEGVRIWPDAQGIHGISPRHVRNAPRLREVENRLVHLVNGKLVVIYNADFDIGFLQPSLLDSAGAFVCAMKLFKIVQPQGRAGLAEAERWAGAERDGARRHRAVSDANATRLVWHRIRERCGRQFSEAVARAAVAPEAKAMRDERLQRERARRTITVHVGDTLTSPQPASIKRSPDATIQPPKHAFQPRWGLITALALIVALFLAWFI